MIAFGAACAPKAPPAVVGAPKHPDFMFPVAPEGTLPAQVSRLDRGWQYLQIDDTRNAEREFLAAIKEQAAFYPADAALGYVALARGNETNAVARFDRALATEATYVPALVGRGRALLELDRIGEALVNFEAALAVDPTLVDLKGRVEVLRFRATQDMLGRAKAATDGRRWDEAKAAYLQAIAASPDSAFLYRELAAVEQKAGDPAGALDHYRKAVELDATDARSWAAIGGLLEANDDVVGALSAYEQARAIDLAEVPESAVARVHARAAFMKLPAEYRAIPGNTGVARGEVAALIGIRLETLVARARPRQLIITDVRGHWAQQWITAVARAGIMDPLPNYQFQPGLRARRGEFALTVSRLLGLVGAAKPDLLKKWQATKVTVNDVPAGHLSYSYVSQAVAAGVMPLVNGNFDLLRNVSGAEAIEIIGRIEALAKP
ncbi:MAG: S-layer homology domain-containing protein [Acidobacteriota bacterium]|nr:S-layer homology domain-containing protein [Acidobacteriota bacterium]